MSAPATPGPIWFCKIGTRNAVELPRPADPPMREAVEAAFKAVTGVESEFLFSGWSAELTDGELAVVEDRLPTEEEYRRWVIRDAAPEMAALLARARGSLAAMMDAWFDYHDAHSLTEPVTGRASNAFDQALNSREAIDALLARIGAA
jgi:hypothetical protein